MARFYASIRGNRGEATRMGTKESGISGHIRGWNIGIMAGCFVGKDGKDYVEIYLTNGSNGVSGFHKHKKLGTWSEDTFKEDTI